MWRLFAKQTNKLLIKSGGSYVFRFAKHMLAKLTKTDVNTRNNDGHTALMFASRYSDEYSNIETVKLLIKSGADVNARNNQGKTALMIAGEKDRKSVV